MQLLTWFQTVSCSYGAATLGNAFHRGVNLHRKLLCPLPKRLKANRTPVLPLTFDHHGQVFITQLILELFAPLEQTRAFVAKHVKDARVFEFVGMLQTIQVKVKKRNPAAVMLCHQCKRWTGHGMGITQTARHALGEMSLAHTKPAGENENIALVQKSRDQFSKALGILDRLALIAAPGLSR